MQSNHIHQPLKLVNYQKNYYHDTLIISQLLRVLDKIAVQLEEINEVYHNLPAAKKGILSNREERENLYLRPPALFARVPYRHI